MKITKIAWISSSTYSQTVPVYVTRTIMWISRTKVIEMIEKAAQCTALQAQVDDLTARNRALLSQIEVERSRAQNAVDALLLKNSALPITPTPPSGPEPAMYDDDPDELKELYRRMRTDPVGVLMDGGRGDGEGTA